MKVSSIPGMVAIAVLGTSLFLGGCSDPQKVALKNLKAKGYELSVKDLLVASASGDVEGLDLFQAAGMEIDSVDPAGNTALIKAAGSGHAQAVERILGLGADPRRVNGAGRDALISASSKGYEEVARMLLSRGADTSIRDSEGWGALSIAAYNGHSNVVSLLAASAAPAELDDALLVASFSGDAKVINSLLGQGANINARSPESKTPLMIASEAGQMEAVRALLQNQANPYAVDLNNQTAANLALAAGHEEVTKMITNPDSWGTSEEGQKIAGEMAKAQEALGTVGVEEVLLEGKPLSGEPTRGDIVKSAPSRDLAAKSSPTSYTGEAVAPESASSPAIAPKTHPGATMIPLSVSAPASKQTASGPAPLRAATIPASHEGGAVASASVDAIRPANTRITTSRKVREEAKSKPIVALNGSTIHSRSPQDAPVKGMVLAAYHEESLPLVVDGVSGSTASVRRLDQAGGSVAVEEGKVIPGTPYKVKEVKTRFVSSKEGKGRMVDVSRVTVEDTKSGSTHLLVKDVSGQTSDTYAILTAPNSQYRYVVKAGDVFRTTQPEIGTKDYQVLDIRANAVVIKDLATEEVVTVARDGVIAP